MCMCAVHPNVNGQPGYCWNDARKVSVHPVFPPELQEGESLLFDEPGRCGGIDAHSHHYRVIGERYGGYVLAVRHGGGEERFRLSNAPAVIDALRPLDTHARYWLLHAMESAASDAARAARDRARETWSRAIVEKRVRVRRRRNGTTRVEIIDPAMQEAAL